MNYVAERMIGVEQPAAIEPGYSIWLWAHVSEDREFAKAMLAELATRIDRAGEYQKQERTRNDPHQANLALRGLIGTARLAALLEDSATAGRAAAAAQALMPARLALLKDDGVRLRGFEQNKVPPEYQVEDKGSHLFRRSSSGPGGQGSRVLQFRDMVPEVARLLGDADPASLRRMTANVDNYMPGWYIAWGERRMAQETPHWVDGIRKFQPYVYAESFTVYPDVPHSIFLCKALIAQEPSMNLERYADVPWCAGDLFYIEKLVRAIDSCGTMTWTRLDYAPAQ
jgi:hypothetical protein